jgi:acyl CoA:acetate/3-ketoacid CoA transferase beta subunit
VEISYALKGKSYVTVGINLPLLIAYFFEDFKAFSFKMNGLLVFA